MRVVLSLFGLAAIIGGILILGGAESAVHEIESLILFLIATVFITGACIVESVQNLEKQITARPRPDPATQKRS